MQPHASRRGRTARLALVTLLLATAALLSTACQGDILGGDRETVERPGEPTTRPPVTTPPTPTDDPLFGDETDPDSTPTGVVTTPHGDGELVPVAPRSRRRMDIDQLDMAIRQVTGGIAWQESNGDLLFEELASTLGKPDLVESTVEDKEASLLFARFLGEAARTACTDLAELEREGRADGELVLMVEAGPEDRDGAAIDANLARLLMRYHSRKLTAADPQFGQWRELFDGALTATDDPVLAWRTVCVGLISHPDFYTY